MVISWCSKILKLKIGWSGCCNWNVILKSRLLFWRVVCCCFVFFISNNKCCFWWMNWKIWLIVLWICVLNSLKLISSVMYFFRVMCLLINWKKVILMKLIVKFMMCYCKWLICVVNCWINLINSWVISWWWLLICKLISSS